MKKKYFQHPAQDGFEYWARAGNRFGLSKNGNPSGVSWRMILHVYDFVWFSDLSGSTLVNATANQAVGSSPVSFPLDFQSIPPQFFVGDRIYFETMFLPKSMPNGLVENVVDTRLVDFNDLPKRKRISAQTRQSKEKRFTPSSVTKQDRTSTFLAILPLFFIIPGVVLFFVGMVSRPKLKVQ